MNKLLTATIATAALGAGAAAAQDSGEPIKLGILFGFTGPIESLTPPMASAVNLAVDEIDEAGGLLDGRKLETDRADSTCIDNAAATSAAERMITADGVKAIVGAACSGTTAAVLANVARPNGVVMISPSATSPSLSNAEDDGLFFRTSPSDARQGKVIADILDDQGIDEVAVTYTNNDYGKGLANSFVSAFEDQGGTVTIDTPHQDGKGDYSAEVGSMASAGGEALVVLGYADQGGKGIIQAALDTGAFGKFVLGDGMYSQPLMDDLGQYMNGSIGAVPWSQGEGTEAFDKVAKKGGVDSSATYTRESYDAVALIALAMQAAGSADSEEFKGKVMDVANEPGEKILPGELGKGLDLAAEGEEIDYVGATNVELIEPGEAAGTYREYVIKDGDYETVKFR